MRQIFRYYTNGCWLWLFGDSLARWFLIRWGEGDLPTSASVRIRQDYSFAELRRLASCSKDANQGRWLLSLAAVLDGMNRADAALIGGMDRQTLRDWVHRFNNAGPEGLFDQRSGFAAAG